MATTTIDLDTELSAVNSILGAIGPQVQVTSGDVSVIYQGDVILGRLAMGVAPLNPAAAVELVAGTGTLSGATAAF